MKKISNSPDLTKVVCDEALGIMEWSDDGVRFHSVARMGLLGSHLYLSREGTFGNQNVSVPREAFPTLIKLLLSQLTKEERLSLLNSQSD